LAGTVQAPLNFNRLRLLMSLWDAGQHPDMTKETPADLVGLLKQYAITEAERFLA
jgi:hypothetical protein